MGSRISTFVPFTAVPSSTHIGRCFTTKEAVAWMLSGISSDLTISHLPLHRQYLLMLTSFELLNVAVNGFYFSCLQSLTLFIACMENIRINRRDG